MAASDARPVPRKNVAYRFYFAIRKPSDSTLITTWAGQDSEVSLDGAAYSDCTNEATEIGTTGTGFIDLTSGEMNADCVLLKVTVTNTGAVPLLFALYPEESGDYRADVTMISGDATAADNAEAFFDGTGYAGTNNVIPTVTTVTNQVTAAAIADQVWDEAQAAHVGAGTFGIIASWIADILVDTSTTLQAELDGIQADTEDIQTRLPAALVSGRIDASVGAMAANVFTASALATDASNKIADHVLRRTQANVEASSNGDAVSIGCLYGLVQQAQESNTVDNAGFLTIYKVDGTTELAQRAVTTDAAAVPHTGIS